MEYINFRISARNIVILVLSIQISLLGLITLNYFGIKIPLLMQLIGFIYLSFVPGFLFLKILKIDKLNLIEIFSYSVGASLFILMSLGLIINLIYYTIGISNPISLQPLLITISFLILFLLLFFYKRNSGESFEITFSNFFANNKIVTILLIVLPFISIIGTYLFNLNISNILIVLLFPLIAIIALIFVFKNNSPEIYPLAIFSISISLLFQRSLISYYLTGYDIQSEYYYASLVLKHSFLNLNISGSLSSVLSVTIINPIYSIILNINQIWVFKIIYPLFFSIVPLYLFNLYSKAFNTCDEKLAFFSVLLFMSFYAFFTEMLGLARQEIAMLFMVLITGLILTKRSIKVNILIFIFLVSLVISHYTSAYIYFFLLLIFMVQYLKRNKTIGFTFIVLYFVIMYFWYVYTSQGANFEGAFNFIYSMFSSVNNEFFSMGTRDVGVGYVTGQIPEISIQRKSFAILQYLIQFSIVFGIITTIIKKYNSYKIDKDYLIFVYGSFMFLILTIVLPVLSKINVSRIFLYCLMFLAPISIIGGIFIFKLIFKLKSRKLSKNNALNMFIILITIPYLLLNTGFVYYITNDNPSSISLDKNMDYAKYSKSEINSANWLISNDNKKTYIFGDLYGALVFRQFTQETNINTIMEDSYWNKKKTYFFYFRNLNVKEDKFYVQTLDSTRTVKNDYVNSTSINFPITNQLYDNGGSKVLITS